MSPEIRRSGALRPAQRQEEKNTASELADRIKNVVDESASHLAAKNWTNQEALNALKTHAIKDFLRLSDECNGRWTTVRVRLNRGTLATTIGTRPGINFRLPVDFPETYTDIASNDAWSTQRALIMNALTLLQCGSTSFAEMRARGIKIRPRTGTVA